MSLALTAFAQIGHIASQRPVHAALAWLHLHEQGIMRWQSECVAIPAPPFAEQPRSEWLLARFRELALHEAQLDEAGNVLGTLSPASPNADLPVVLLSAHVDTVFPAETPLHPMLEGSRLHAPGACDNGAGLAALLAVAAALRHSAIAPACRVVFLANVGEEGEGDLRGVRHVYAHAPWRERIVAHLVLDGAGQNVAVTSALGSRRFEVTLAGVGGHSWTDAGRPNPVAALADGITRLTQLQAALSSSREDGICSRSTWNIGTIEGGASVNSIPASATGRFDLRSTSPDDLLRLEVQLHRAIEDAVLAANAGALPEHCLRPSFRVIGSRPTGSLPESARMLALLRAVDRHLGLRTELRTASTDANIPLSLGIEALSIGAGGEGGGIHTTAEWFDARGRDLGLRRILLLLLALADCHSATEGESS